MKHRVIIRRMQYRSARYWGANDKIIYGPHWRWVCMLCGACDAGTWVECVEGANEHIHAMLREAVDVKRFV